MSDAGKTGGEGGDAGQKTGDDGTKGDAGQGKGGNPEIQKVIDGVVARERARAEKATAELQAHIDGLKTQLEEIGKGKGGKHNDDEFKAAVDRARKPVEDALAAEKSKLQGIHSRIARAELKSAAADDAVDAEVVADLLNGRVRITETGEVEVVGKDGKPEYGAKGPKTVKELVAELLSEKTYLAKSKARDGIDFQSGARSTSGKSKDELKTQIAALEAAGKYDDALKLQAELHRLVGVHTTS